MANKTINSFTAGTPEQAMNFLMQTSGDVTGKMNLETAIGEKHIYTMADFPTAVGGIRTIPTGVYIIHGALSTGDTLRIAEDAVVYFKGNDAFSDGIIYTGSGNMFDTNNLDISSLSFFEMFVVCQSGTVFDLTGTVAKTSSCFILSCAFVGVGSMGTVTNYATFVLINSAITDWGVGISLITCQLIALHVSQIKDGKDSSGTMIDVSGTMGLVILSSLITTPEASESVINIDSGITINGGSITGSSFDNSQLGVFFKSGSLDQTNKFWTVKSNSNVPDSASNAELFISSSSATSLTQNIPALCAGTWADSAERFTTTSEGRATYAGLETIKLTVSINPSAIAGAVNQDVSFYISKGNDTDNTITAFADAGGGQVTVTSTAHGLSNSDRVPITGTTSYNGTFTIANVTANTFEITDTFVADDATGNWQIIIERSKSTNLIASTTKPSSTGVMTKITFVTNDFVEFFVENNSGNNTITVNDANILIG